MKLRPLIICSLLLIVLGSIIYFSWGLLYNSWFDRGVYSLVVPIILFGVFGLLLGIHARDQ